MWTELPEEYLATSTGQRANEILRKCVHCGFCNATCPTYQLTGDELDGPRGRIYLIKELLESDAQDKNGLERARRHLDRCLTCRSCETTCPSGVDYGELAEIARNRIGPQRSGVDNGLRLLFKWMVPNAARLRVMSRIGKWFRLFLPTRLASQIPRRIGRRRIPGADVENAVMHVVILNGCAQQVSTPSTNDALIALLESRRIKVSVLEDEGCCGSLDLHLGDEASALARIRHNVGVLRSKLDEEDGVDAIISTASGCGVTVKDYGRLLACEADYAEDAVLISSKTVDVAEFLHRHRERLALSKATPHAKVAWHAPCTLQHGQKVSGLVETLLRHCGYELVDVADAHLCCGSAGTYSILQPALAEQLKQRKWDALTQQGPDVIATANVGCQTHLGTGGGVEVLHWVELVR